MARLVKDTDVINALIDFQPNWSREVLRSVIDNIPTPVTPDVHGHWEECSYWFVRCSVCQEVSFGGGENYCPKCGSKMDEVEK